MRLSILAYFLGVLATALSSNASAVVCTVDNMIAWSDDRIEVKLADNSTYGFEVVGVPTDDAEQRLLRAISFINAYNGSHVQFVYSGRGCTPTTNDGYLCVHAWDCGYGASGCGTSQACEQSIAWDGNGRGTDAWVRIVGGGACFLHAIYTDYPFDVDLSGAGGFLSGVEDDLVSLLVHELWHAVIGGQHCDGSRNASGGSESPLPRYLSRVDVQNARLLYGDQTNTSVYIESTSSGYSWGAGSPAFPSGRSYRFGSITNGASYLGTAGPYYFDNAVYFKKLTSSGWQASVRIDPTDAGLSWSPASVAYGNGTLVATWLANESTSTWYADIRVAVSTDGGATWPTAFYLTNAVGSRYQTTRKSVNIGYDPYRQRFIVLWHNNADQVSYVTMASSSPSNTTLWYHGALDDMVLDGATIACSSATGYNCVMLWTEIYDDYCFTWRTGGLSSSGAWLKEAIRTQCYDGWSQPSIAFDPGSATYPFVTSVLDPDTTVVSYRKTSAYNAFWQDARTMSTSPNFASPPAIGTWQNGATWELGMFTVVTSQ